MRFSIRRQFAGIFIALLAGTILLCWFINNSFLERYYISSKASVIYLTYDKISKVTDGNLVSTESLQELNDTCLKHNISALLINPNSQSIYASINGGNELGLRLMLYLTHRLEVEENTVQRIRDRDNNEYMEMYGTLGNGNSYIIRTPMEGIRESASIANRFLAYVGSVMVVLSGVIVWMISRKITEPIMELASISERMINLDFEAKYHSGSKNEIALLGENINKLSESLEKTISELKTANNELIKDIEKKEQIDEMRKDFLSNVSHELKTPIALIQGYAEGLKEGINDDSESRDFYCEVIIDESAKMNNLVKKLLTLNQLEFGNDIVAMERFDVVVLIYNYIQSAGILTRQNDIEVRIAEQEPIYVWGDEFKTEEIFTNFFSNAVNHCSGKKIIDVKIEQKEGKVRVAIFNTGDPIPEDALGHIWEKFYKVDKARTREYGGSGVGLSIVKAMMESMNQQYGVINFTNGVQFWFELDAVREEI